MGVRNSGSKQGWKRNGSMFKKVESLKIKYLFFKVESLKIKLYLKKKNIQGRQPLMYVLCQHIKIIYEVGMYVTISFLFDKTNYN